MGHCCSELEHEVKRAEHGNMFFVLFICVDIEHHSSSSFFFIITTFNR